MARLVRVWILSLAVVAAVVATLTAQRSSFPRVITGPDVGFRVDGISSGRVLGSWVVRINGEWQEISTIPRLVPAPHHPAPR